MMICLQSSLRRMSLWRHAQISHPFPTTEIMDVPLTCDDEEKSQVINTLPLCVRYPSECICVETTDFSPSN